MRTIFGSFYNLRVFVVGVFTRRDPLFCGLYIGVLDSWKLEGDRNWGFQNQGFFKEHWCLFWAPHLLDLDLQHARHTGPNNPLLWDESVYFGYFGGPGTKLGGWLVEILLLKPHCGAFCCIVGFWKLSNDPQAQKLFVF